MEKLFPILLVFLLMSATLSESQSKKELEKEILNKILNKTEYDTRIIPTNNNVNGTDGPVTVEINVYMRSIEYICSKKQEWKLQITLRHKWNDPRLQFDNHTGKVEFVHLGDPALIWTPDTFIANSKTTQLNTDLKPNNLVRIFSDGNVLYSTRLTTTLNCAMDLTNYPFDSQICSIRLASYGYSTDDVKYIWKDEESIQLPKNLRVPGFVLNTATTDYCTSKTITGEYSCLRVNCDFKRVSSSYICSWLLPTALITFLSFASFWIKPKKSSRVKLLLISLLVLYLHIIYINNKTSQAISYSTAKDCWLYTCLIFVLGAFVEYGIVKLIDKHNKQTNSNSNIKRNDKLCDPERDAVALKPLVEDGKDRRIGVKNKDKKDKQSSNQNINQKWQNASIGYRIDLLSAILFPFLFIVYIIVFFCCESIKH